MDVYVCLLAGEVSARFACAVSVRMCYANKRASEMAEGGRSEIPRNAAYPVIATVESSIGSTTIEVNSIVLTS